MLPSPIQLESLVGEIRVNLIRITAIIVFFLNHLVAQYSGLSDVETANWFHFRVSAISGFWFLTALTVYFWTSLSPWSMKGACIVTALDLTMIGLLVTLSPAGPRSVLVFLFPIVIVAAALRLHLRLVYFTTLGALLAYGLCLGQFVFLKIGVDQYYSTGSDLRIPRDEQCFVALLLFVTGLIAGQYVRQALRLSGAVALQTEEAEATKHE